MDPRFGRLIYALGIKSMRIYVFIKKKVHGRTKQRKNYPPPVFAPILHVSVEMFVISDINAQQDAFYSLSQTVDEKRIKLITIYLFRSV